MADDDDFDGFFDSPRQKCADMKISKTRRTVDLECTNENSQCHKIHEPAGKPPSHPNSRPGSAATKSTRSGRTSPSVFERNCKDDSHDNVPGPRRVIEAKVPCDVTKQDDYDDDEDGSYSDDSFVDEDDGSPAEETSTHRSPVPHLSSSDQQFWGKEIPAFKDDKGLSVSENSARNLSDYLTESDADSEVTDVSPLSTPHSPAVQMKPSHSSSVTKYSSKSSSNEPVGLLKGDRDSLDLDVLLQTVLHMEKRGRSLPKQTSTQVSVPSRGNRRNYSFTNEQVEAIDKENYRLMTRIMKHANGTKTAKAKVKKQPTSGFGMKRPPSAAVNRAKQQQKIEAENLMLLHRLQQTRPTKELRRDVLVGSQSGRSTGSARPISAGHARAPSASSGQRPGSGTRARPSSAHTAVQHYSCSSRPETAIPSRLDDDDVLTWQQEDF